MVPLMRGSSTGRKPTLGISSRLASSSFDPKYCTKLPSSRSKPCAQVVSQISSRILRQRSTGPSKPNISALLIARSNATHAITFEWVNCRRPPRISQMPSSGSCQMSARCSSSLRCTSQPDSWVASPLRRA